MQRTKLRQRELGLDMRPGRTAIRKKRKDFAGREGVKIADAFCSGKKTAREIAEETPGGLNIVLPFLKKVVGVDIPTDKLYRGGKFVNRPQAPQGALQRIINLSAIRTINVTRLLELVHNRTLTGARVMVNSVRVARGKSKLRVKLNKNDVAMIGAVKFILAYPNTELLRKGFGKTHKTRAFVSGKALTNYLTQKGFCINRNVASQVITMLEEEHIIERVSPGGVRILDDPKWDVKK
ncbi:MAG: hypothetical protein HOE11_04915 [Candidatus Diapherotrites archaeon]|jgi:hypothetical protein|nr:hypothetical protein [Candidatus Diapherotrites archaeon]MBT4596796.1 hypothetical protein [Candidatus Diapherotrites archaeon]